MLALLARILGLWLVAAALVELVVDATRSIANSGIEITPLGGSWLAQVPARLTGTEPLTPQDLEAMVNPLVWNALLRWLLMLPGWAVLGVVGFALLYIGRRRDERDLLA